MLECTLKNRSWECNSVVKGAAKNKTKMEKKIKEK
jgi:hypothetical protein